MRASKKNKARKVSEVVAKVVEIQASFEEGRMADHGFDGGEFGDPESHKMEEREIDRYLSSVGVSRQEIDVEITSRFAHRSGLLV